MTQLERVIQRKDVVGRTTAALILIALVAGAIRFLRRR